MFIEVTPVWWVNVDCIGALRVETGINGIPQVTLVYTNGAPGAPTVFTGEEAQLLIEALTPLLAARCVASTEVVVDDPEAKRGHRVERVAGRVGRLT